MRIAAVLIVGVIIAAAALLIAFKPGRTRASANTCVNNLRQLDGVKQAWALDHKMPSNAVPALQDLQAYLLFKLECPEGGTYNAGAVHEPATCTVGGRHALPAAP